MYLIVSIPGYSVLFFIGTFLFGLKGEVVIVAVCALLLNLYLLFSGRH